MGLNHLEEEVLPSGVLEVYETFVVSSLPEGYLEGCLAWRGPVKVPGRPGGYAIPSLIYEGRIYSAALVSWAFEHGRPYPYAWAKYNCGDMRCVNGKHISPKVQRMPGRPGKTKGIEDTVNFKERHEIITEMLKFEPNTTADEILSRLRAESMGGKTATILGILSRVRKELGLPARIPSRRGPNYGIKLTT